MITRCFYCSIACLCALAGACQSSFAQGAELWARRYDGGLGKDDQAVAIALDSHGNAFVAGFTAITGHGWDMLTIKYGPGGRRQWVRTFDGPAHRADAASAIAVDTAGNAYVTGFSHAG